MKTAGIIAEYNPFHTGHEYQINYIKEKLRTDYVVIAMSGDFVQRGTPALFSKYVRAEMALRSGADLVLELPVSISSASAELFARGGVQLLDGLGVTDILCFGSECGDTDALAKILAEEPEAFQDALRRNLKDGMTFPKARSMALSAVFPESEKYQQLLSSPNNILGIEYCKAILHPGEMSRLTGLSVEAVQADREGVARRYAAQWNAVVVLKGARTVVAAPDGRVCVNPTGNPGLARGGSGDVLAGMTSALLACGLSACEAAACAVWLHGAAADRAARQKGEYGMLPQDIFVHLGQMFAENDR